MTPFALGLASSPLPQPHKIGSIHLHPREGPGCAKTIRGTGTESTLVLFVAREGKASEACHF